MENEIVEIKTMNEEDFVEVVGDSKEVITENESEVE